MNSTTFRAGKSRLIYCDDGLPGLTRRKAGSSWDYFNAAGARVTNRDEIDRLNRIALPPAYGDAWFCPADNGHLLATGIETYAKANQSFGATTLRMRHAAVAGNVLKLRFKAKSGKLCEMKITDKSLARLLFGLHCR